MGKLEVVSVRLKTDATLMSDKPLNNPEEVVEFIREELRLCDREVLCILNLTTACCPVNLYISSVGGINKAIAEPREIFKGSFLSNASHMILIHNHPSGNVKPSEEDIRFTKRLVMCGQLLGVPVLDHIIIGGYRGDTYSFKKHGDMDTIEGEITYARQVAENLTGWEEKAEKQR